METDIHLYPADLAIEDVPAQFNVEKNDGIFYATLEQIKLGGLALDRYQVIRMIGDEAVRSIDDDISERLNMNTPGTIAAE